MLATILVLSLLAGISAGWATLDLGVRVFGCHVSVWTFLTVWIVTLAYASCKRIHSRVVGTGLYVIGLFLLMKPVLWFAHSVSPQQTADEQTIAVQYLASHVIWSVGLVLLVTVLFAGGKYCRSRARRVKLATARQRLRYRK